MTTPRSVQVHPDATPYYHCMSRCVRQAFLLGTDETAGRNFDHRKEWVVEELAKLEQVFAIDVCAYAVMSNHVHLVVRLNVEDAARWSDEDVLLRMRKLFPTAVSLAENTGVAPARVGEYRARLVSLSWFMRCLNERIARRANSEDGCTGRFWEGRFKCRALLDLGAVLSCMAYVDLNPVHAGLAASLSESDFTSIQDRLVALGRSLPQRGGSPALQPSDHRRPALVPFVGDAPLRRLAKEVEPRAIPFDLVGYVDLVRFSGAAIRGDKAGHLSDAASTVLHNTGLSVNRWRESLCALSTLKFAALGERHLIDLEAQRCGLRRAPNARWVERAYSGSDVAETGAAMSPFPHGRAA